MDQMQSVHVWMSVLYFTNAHGNFRQHFWRKVRWFNGAC